MPPVTLKAIEGLLDQKLDEKFDEKLFPIKEDLNILRTSVDHLVKDATDSKQELPILRAVRKESKLYW